MLKTTMSQNADSFRWLGTLDYTSCLRAMQDFVQQADITTPDVIWMLQHHPVITTTKRDKSMAQVPLHTPVTPVVETDRGGMVSFHAPGQLVCYPMIRLQRHGLSVRDLVRVLLNATADTVVSMGIPDSQVCVVDSTADRIDGLPAVPGLYIQGSKVASIGLRIRRGISYHGISLNCDIDLSRFAGLHPCGLHSNQTGHLLDWLDSAQVTVAEQHLRRHLLRHLPKLRAEQPGLARQAA